MVSEPMDDMTPLEPLDPELRSALVARFGETPAAQIDWEAQAGRITDAARFRLAARARGGWRRPAARWARQANPAGLAASILLAVGAALSPAGDDASADDPGMREVAAVAATDAISSDPLMVTDQELALSILLTEER
jgi:hypothetical protein